MLPLNSNYEQYRMTQLKHKVKEIAVLSFLGIFTLLRLFKINKISGESGEKLKMLLLPKYSLDYAVKLKTIIICKENVEDIELAFL